jgi:NADH dehydrogenase [ubiquinone] 1 alpha subcomplex assembly factor 1
MIKKTVLMTYLALASFALAENTLLVADFKSEKTSLKWKTINDSVMGGVSKGDSQITEDSNLLFKGKISLENRGGFSSVRSYGERYDFSEFKGVEIRVKGDGRKFYFTSQSDKKEMISFWKPVETKDGEWQTVQIPFAEFYATTFGQTIPGLKLNTSNITSFGLMLYDKKDGRFSIELDYIKTYK